MHTHTLTRTHTHTHHSIARVKQRPDSPPDLTSDGTVSSNKNCETRMGEEPSPYELPNMGDDTHTYDTPGGEMKHDLSLTADPTHQRDAGTGAEVRDVEKGLTSSHSSSNSVPSPTDLTSAAPLVHNGVDSKKNPFTFKKQAFKLEDPPMGSPRSRGSVLSSDSHHRNNSMDGGSQTGL